VYSNRVSNALVYILPLFVIGRDTLLLPTFATRWLSGVERGAHCMLRAPYGKQGRLNSLYLQGYSHMNPVCFQRFSCDFKT
jgi:hypothetical protein